MPGGSGGRAAASACGTSAVRPSDLAARAAAGAHRASRARAAVPGPDASRASSSAAAATGPGGRSARTVRPCRSLNRAPSRAAVSRLVAGRRTAGDEGRHSKAQRQQTQRVQLHSYYLAREAIDAGTTNSAVFGRAEGSQPSPKREQDLS